MKSECAGCGDYIYILKRCGFSKMKYFESNFGNDCPCKKCLVKVSCKVYCDEFRVLIDLPAPEG